MVQDLFPIATYFVNCNVLNNFQVNKRKVPYVESLDGFKAVPFWVY